MSGEAHSGPAPAPGPQDDVPAGWEGILEPGETILWQGRPDTTITWTWAHVAGSLGGLFFAGFSVVWMVMASQAPGDFWMFGLIHFFVGLSIALGPPIASAWRRRHTWYTLTDRRAFIATDFPGRGRKLTDYPITSATALDYNPGHPATIHFAHDFRRTKKGSTRVPIGFERIADGAEVMRLMRGIRARRPAA